MTSILNWLLNGDVSIQFHTHRLIGSPETTLFGLRDSIALKGWGYEYLNHFNPNHQGWGEGTYSPKWTSTHYTLWELKYMGLDPQHPYFQLGLQQLLNDMWPPQGIINKYRHQDMCVVAMMLDLSVYAQLNDPRIDDMVDYMVDHVMEDGGWNCAWERGAIHSSLHTSLTVLETIRDYIHYGYNYRINDLKRLVSPAQEFILKKKLFRSVRTNEIISDAFLKLHHPFRWHYDVLRALEYFASIDHPYDSRMDESINHLLSKQINGTWRVASPYPSKVFFHMECSGKPSRWITYRMLKILKCYRPKIYQATLTMEVSL